MENNQNELSPERKAELLAMFPKKQEEQPSEISEERKRELLAMFPEKTATVEEEPSYLDTAVDRVGDFIPNISDSLSKRNLELGQTQADYDSGEINIGEWALQTIGKGLFGSVADIAGETAATILSAMTPDDAEKQIKQWAEAGADNILSTETAQDLLEFYGELDPNTRKNIESAANIVAVIAPKGISKTGKALKDSGKASAINAKKKKLAETVLDYSAKAKKKRKEKGGNSDFEDKMLNTLLDTKGVKPGAKPETNIAKINVEQARLDAKISAALKETKDFKINGKLLKKNIPLAAAAKLPKDPKYNTSSALNLKKELEFLLITDKDSYIKDGVMTVPAIHKARIAFDNALKGGRESNKDSIFVESGISGEIIRAYRDSLNDVVDGLSAKKGIEFKDLRTRKSHLYAASSNLASNDSKVKNLGQKAISYAMSHPFTVGAAASAATGAGGGLFANPAIIGAGIVGLGGVGLTKAATAPATRVGLGGMLQSQVPTAAAAASLYGATPEDEQQVQQLLNQ